MHSSRSDRVAIATGARQVERARVEVGGEDLHFGRAIERRHIFAQQDRDRIGFFARRAAQHPHAKLVLGALALEQPRQLALEQVEFGGIAEELRHADQQILEQMTHLLVIVPQPRHIGVDVVELEDLHAAENAAHERAALVAVEIVPGDVSQHRGDLRDLGLDMRERRRAIGVGRVAQARDIARDLGRDVRERQPQVDDAGGIGRALADRFGEPCGFRDRQAAEALRRGHAGAAVGIDAVEQHGDGAFLGLFGDRDQQRVDRAAMADRLAGRPRAQMAVGQRHQIVGAAEIDVVGAQHFAVGGDFHRHRGGSPQRGEHEADVESVLLAHGDDVGRPAGGVDLAENMFERA
jgi:hypothetical protein